MQKLKKFSLILSLIAPVLLVAATATVVIFAWYVSMIQTGEIDASTKNLAIEYTFDNNTKKNQTKYTVKNLAFFDVDSTNEVSYIEAMATKLTINLKNNSSSSVKYTIIFQANKTILKNDDEYQVATVTEDTFDTNGSLYSRSGAGTEQSPYVYTAITTGEFSGSATYYEKTDKSNAYIDCLFSVVNDRNYTTVDQFKSYPASDITYENNKTKVLAMKQPDQALPVYGTTYEAVTVTQTTFKTDGSLYTRSGAGTAADPYVYSSVITGSYDSGTTYYKDSALTTIDLYLYGVQEVDTAQNDDFIYQTVGNVKTMRTYSFTLTIIADPVGDAVIEENEQPTE